MISLVQRDDVTPICPYCEVELHDVSFQELSGFLGRRYVYFCPQCHKVLGLSHRKGLWMG
jgi:uncharacterized protein with PIN domain